MNCSWNEQVSLLIDGELPPSKLTAVEQHLIGCVECQQVRADFLSLRNQLSSYAPALAGISTESALAKVLDSSDAPVVVKQPTRRFGLGFILDFRAVAFAAVIIAALVIGIAIYRNLHRVDQSNYTATTRNVTTLPPVISQQSHTPPVTSVVVSKPLQAQLPVKRKPTSKVSDTTVALAQPNDVATVRPNVSSDSTPAPVRAADAQTLTAIHFEKAELLLRTFRNVRLSEPGVRVEVSYEKQKAQQLIYQNMMLRREADSTGDVQVSSLLENLEPILIDIANLPDKPGSEDIRVIKDRVEKKNIVALLQVNSTTLARALD